MYVIETIYGYGALAATAYQRWRGLKKLDSDADVLTGPNIIKVSIITVIILSAMFFAVSFFRIYRERKTSNKLFSEYSEQRGLTFYERQLLLHIAHKAQLRQPEVIFSMVSAFDTGAAKAREELLKRQDINETNQMETCLFSLREKLGFRKSVSFSRGTPATARKLSSREIPIEKEVYVTCQNMQGTEPIKAIVVKNTDTELVVELTQPATIIFGEHWSIRYYLGASIWEFDSFVLSYDGNVMALNHSDEIKFINRRRFLRVPVSKPAFIAQFPFELKISRSIEAPADKSGAANQDFPEVPLQPLRFVPAMVTELGGPGLRIESSLKVNVGDRILIMFELDREKERNLVRNNETDEFSEIATTTLKIAEDIGVIQEIGQVRRTAENIENISIAVELTGLGDSDIDCLIRATNAASISNKNQNTLETAEQISAEMKA